MQHSWILVNCILITMWILLFLVYIVIPGFLTLRSWLKFTVLQGMLFLSLLSKTVPSQSAWLADCLPVDCFLKTPLIACIYMHTSILKWFLCILLVFLKICGKSHSKWIVVLRLFLKHQPWIILMPNFAARIGCVWVIYGQLCSGCLHGLITNMNIIMLSTSYNLSNF